MNNINYIPGENDNEQRGNNPFRVPDGYFESLPDQIRATIESSNREEITRSNPFSVPDNYFSSLPGKINERIHSSSKKGEVVTQEVWTVRRRKKIAFATIGLSLIIACFIYFNRETKEPIESQELTLNEVEISGFLAGVDESTLTDMYAELHAGETTTIENSDIEQYLIENNIDISQLESKL